jgi:hypothetical protein
MGRSSPYPEVEEPHKIHAYVTYVLPPRREPRAPFPTPTPIHPDDDDDDRHYRTLTPLPQVFHLEFVDKGFLDAWLRSTNVRKTPSLQLYTPEVGYGIVRDDEEGLGKTVANTVLIYRVPGTNQHYVHRFRFDEPQQFYAWINEVSNQPKDNDGPGRPPKRWLQLTDYTQRSRSYR